jgi:hypothetical protein
MKNRQTWLLIALALLLAGGRCALAPHQPRAPPPDSLALTPAKITPSTPPPTRATSWATPSEHPIAPISAQRGAPDLAGALPLRPPENAARE